MGSSEKEGDHAGRMFSIYTFAVTNFQTRKRIVERLGERQRERERKRLKTIAKLLMRA